MLRGSRGPIVAGAGVVVFTAIMVFFLVLPKMNEVSSANADLEAAQAQQSTLESQLAALEQAEAAAPEARAAIEEVERRIPPTVDESGLLLLLKNAALRAGVEVPDRVFGTPALDEVSGLSTIPLSLTATGTYFQLAEFLYTIETLPRVAKSLTVSLTSADATDTTTIGLNLLQMQLSVVLYTSDQSAGPGSEPGPTTDAAGVGGA
ncbi:MAG TPA: type 4a pilus biogenesis protein PilO [Actinomycetota bacterium]|nr:type 4a pilus biogenesis protein PilO [Actinomycetota bacterium]